MKGKRNILLGLVIPGIVIIVATNYNILLGLAALIGYIAYMLYSNIAGLYAFRGNAEYNKGNYDEAIKWFKKAYESGKAKPNVRASYGYLLLKSGRLEEAEQVFNKMLGSKLDMNGEMTVKSNLALVYWKKGDLDKAIETLTGVFEKYKNSTIYGSLGYFMILKGDLEKALEFNLGAYDYNDTDKIILDNLAQNYYLMGNMEKAEEIYEKLLKMSPAFPEPYYYYGKVLEAKGDKEKGLDSMRKALGYKFSFLSTTTKEQMEEEIRQLEDEIKSGAAE
jgi:pentatricopeptide repeat protein